MPIILALGRQEDCHQFEVSMAAYKYSKLKASLGYWKSFSKQQTKPHQNKPNKGEDSEQILYFWTVKKYVKVMPAEAFNPKHLGGGGTWISVSLRPACST